MSQSRKEWVDDANMSSRKAPVDYDTLGTFVACHCQPDWSFEFLKNNPALLDTNTILLLEREAYGLLPEIQLDLHSKHYVCRIISAAALLKICAGKSQPEVQKIVERFTSLCMETTLEHLQHAWKICDRIEQMSYVDNEVGVPLRKMSLKDGEVALDQTIQV
ncbi:hypothetical protein NHJ13734_004308 [Beauveria thailandica]